MSEILWCDPGNHQFSANDTGRKTWVEKQSYLETQDGKQPFRFDACSEHRGYDGMGTDMVKEMSRKMQEALVPKTKAVEAKERGYDPGYVKWLEDQADQPIQEA